MSEPSRSLRLRSMPDSSLAMNRPAAFKKLTNLAFIVIKYYEGFLGPFPFRELNIIEINDYGWGQAPPGTRSALV